MLMGIDMTNDDVSDGNDVIFGVDDEKEEHEYSVDGSIGTLGPTT